MSTPTVWSIPRCKWRAVTSVLGQTKFPSVAMLFMPQKTIFEAAKRRVDRPSSRFHRKCSPPLSQRVSIVTSKQILYCSHYGAQAVVVSIDPKRVYVDAIPEGGSSEGDELSRRTVVALPENERGPNGEKYVWWQTTVKGGREYRDIDAIQLAKICALLGAGEIMLNCIDMDGQGKGYDLALVTTVQQAVSIPVIASSGAGAAAHFVEVFQKTPVRAALAAGIFHRHEVGIQEVKSALADAQIAVRR